MDPFRTYHDLGRSIDALRAALAGQTVDDLRAICGRWGLDPSRSYRRQKDHNKLVDLVVTRVEAICGRGKVFLTM